MGCCDNQKQLSADESKDMKVLLMGNPNVGKSVIFSKFTGQDVIASNYTGTTVGFTKGDLNIKGAKGFIIDVPGIYSLQATSPAEEVAIEFMNEGSDIVLFVLDATNLERNLNLALQVKEYNIPIVFALNLMDVAKNQGINIDVEKLSQELDAPVIPTIAPRNIGLKDIMDKILETYENKEDLEEKEKTSMSQDERWKKVGKIVERVQTIEDKEPTFMEKFGEKTLNPLIGIPVSLVVMVLSLAIVVGGGKGLRAGIFLPIINNIVAPFFTSIVSMFVQEGIIYNVLVGEYGILIKGIEWPFALVLPYVFLFYIVLAVLEDSGYLPRLGVILDSVFRKVGLQGGSVIPIIMGYGCAVPAILGSKAATSYKERLIIGFMVSLGIPCVAQTGAFIALLGDHSILLLGIVYLISFMSLIATGFIFNKVLPGKSDPMLLEIPNLLVPNFKAVSKKIWVRTKSFMLEAGVPILFGVGFASLIAETGVLEQISHIIGPFVEGWLGLPKEATTGLVLGIVRRELAVLPMLELDLSTLQLLVGSVVALFYVPCLSVVGVLIKEYGVKIGVAITVSTTLIAFLFGGIINQVGSLF